MNDWKTTTTNKQILDGYTPWMFVYHEARGLVIR